MWTEAGLAHLESQAGFSACWGWSQFSAELHVGATDLEELK